MNYIRDHWRGRHVLPRAFWINFLIPFVMITMGEPWVRPAASDGSILQAVTASLYILIAHAVILPWQIVGLWRSSRRHLEERGDLGVVTFAQAAALIALVTAAGATTTTVQHITGFGLDAGEQNANTQPRYQLNVHPENRTIVIDGPFDVGLSRDLEALLEKTSGVKAIVLNSDGGRVFEARGVAKQILENALDTEVFNRCRSACTIAFIAGKTRKLGIRGQLGFHSYRLEAALAFSDPLEEQAKDEAFFVRQGIKPDFVERAFDTPHDDMWHPDTEHLQSAHVVHEVMTDR